MQLTLFTPITNIEIIVAAIAMVSYIYLGLAVYIRDPKSWTNRLFFLLSLVFITYDIVNPISLHPLEKTPDNQLFWIRMVMFTVSFIGPLIFLLVHTFPRKKISLDKKYLIGIILLNIATAAASLSPLIFESIDYPNGTPTPNPGSGVFLYFLDFPGLILLSIILLISKYRRSIGKEKEQLYYFLIGVFATFSLMAISTFILVAVLKTPAGVFLGHTSPLILSLFIAYAIAKNQFLDIKPAIAKAVSYIFVLIAIAFIYVAVLLLGINLLFGYKIPVENLVLYTVITAVGALSFQPIHKLTRKLTDKIFFKGAYLTEELLTRVGHIISGTIDLEILTTVILRIILKEMRVSKGAFLIIDEHKIINIKQIGFIDHQLSAQQMELLFHYIPLYKLFIFEELEEGELKDFFRKNDIMLALPIRVETNEVAILALGPKLSGEIYSKQDIDFLSIFSSQAGVAIQNAKSYALLQQFSQELEKRVEERTKELKNAQEKELAKAKEVNRLKDEFVFIAAHELQTPVTVIRGFLDLVSEAQSKFPKDIQDYLNSMKNASANLSQLISDLLEIARSEADTIKIEVEPINTGSCLKDEIKKFRETAGKRGIKINVKMPKKSPKIMADLVKTKEVVTNLLSNAVKYNKENGIIDVSVIERE
ncbi:MAG: histidine kinase dimerization/phospho-acceptor domain-containing protein, partial [Patescibacteria group bacterium]